MHIILTGPTGTCGSAVLRYCLAEPKITRISILSRRPVLQAEGQEKAHTVLHEDFSKYPDSLLEKLKGATACIWALGISQTSVTKEEYVKITYDYTMAAAKAFSTLSPSFNFVFVSGEGADQTEHSSQTFAKFKGRTEKELLELDKTTESLNVYAVRPGMIDPQGNNLRQTPESMPKRAFISTMGFIIGNMAKSLHIGTMPLAKALTTLAIGDGKPLPAQPGVEYDGRVLRNTALRKLGGL